MRSEDQQGPRLWCDRIQTPSLGEVWVGMSENGLACVYFSGGEDAFLRSLPRKRAWSVIPGGGRCTEALDQIAEYLKGTRRAFDLPIDWSGMGDFQRRVLHATSAIPYGETRTYGWLAQSLACPAAARAVGRAEATNPMPLVIPCHRVLGSDGSLHGYGGGEGLATKRWLLDLESGALQPALF